MKKHITAALAGVFVISACSNDVLSPDSNLTAEEEADLVALVSEIPFFDDDFGDDGIPTTAAAYFEGSTAAVGPQNWGRRRGAPIRRSVDIEYDRENGLATYSLELEFDGEFLVLDREADQIVRKDLREIRVQTALFQRLDTDRADEQTGHLHRWALVAISPAEFKAPEVENQLVVIEAVRVLVNEELVMEVTDPAELIRIEDRIARLDLESEVTIQAVVANGTLDEFNPEGTFVYLHLRHATTDFRVWRRLPMAYSEDAGAYVASWVVHHRGRERIVVDALDAETINLLVEDPYLSNIWAVPYRSRILTDSAN